MLKLLFSLPGLLTGLFSTIDNVTKAISNERINERNAQTEEARIHSQERIKSLEAKRDLMVVESGVTKANIIVRSAAAVPVVFVLWKLLAWDKVIGSLAGCSRAKAGTCKVFVTDPLSADEWKVVMLVLGFYFLYELGVATMRIAKR